MAAVRTNRGLWRRAFGATATALLIGSAGVLGPAVPASAATPLVGTFTLAAGSCGAGSASGSYIRMILPSGGPSGPFMSNSDSTCGDESYTLLSPGTDGGLATGRYQSPAGSAFDSSGNALARRITAPANYYGTSFATATSPTDPQTRRSVPAPQVSVSGGRLSADLRAFAVTWNNQNFNQGAPKPDGSYPGNTRAASGTYDASTGTFTLQWTSQVIGGPFDKFTGLWHLTGRFVPGGTAAPKGNSPGPAGAGGTPGAGQHAGGAASGGGVVPGSRANPTAGLHRGASPGRSGRPGKAANAAVDASPVASTITISRERWQVSWWLVGAAGVLGVLGVLALVAINRSLRRTPSS